VGKVKICTASVTHNDSISNHEWNDKKKKGMLIGGEGGEEQVRGNEITWRIDWGAIIRSITEGIPLSIVKNCKKEAREKGRNRGASWKGWWGKECFLSVGKGHVVI